MGGSFSTAPRPLVSCTISQRTSVSFLQLGYDVATFQTYRKLQPCNREKPLRRQAHGEDIQLGTLCSLSPNGLSRIRRVRGSDARNASSGDAHARNAHGGPHGGAHGRADGRRTAAGSLRRLWGRLSRHIRSPAPSRRQRSNVELLHSHSRPGRRDRCRGAPEVSDPVWFHRQLLSVQSGDVQDHDRHAGQGLHREDGLQRVQGPLHGPERLEAELHDVRPGPQRNGGTSRDDSGSQRDGLPRQSSGAERNHQALQQRREDLLRRLRGLLRQTASSHRELQTERHHAPGICQLPV